MSETKCEIFNRDPEFILSTLFLTLYLNANGRDFFTPR